VIGEVLSSSCWTRRLPRDHGLVPGSFLLVSKTEAILPGGCHGLVSWSLTLASTQRPALPVRCHGFAPWAGLAATRARAAAGRETGRGSGMGRTCALLSRGETRGCEGTNSGTYFSLSNRHCFGSATSVATTE
jgi:hypothetical protein